MTFGQLVFWTYFHRLVKRSVSFPQCFALLHAAAAAKLGKYCSDEKEEKSNRVSNENHRERFGKTRPEKVWKELNYFNADEDTTDSVGRKEVGGGVFARNNEMSFSGCANQPTNVRERNCIPSPLVNQLPGDNKT